MENVNGFFINGNFWVNEKNVYKCYAICKVCEKEFLTNYHSLSRLKSCGCARPSQLKPLPEIINGFKIIKCLGYDKESQTRWAIVECKVCKKEYEVDPRKLKNRKHCGCLKKGEVTCRYAKEFPRLAGIFRHMKSRCYNSNNQDYYNYGQRGIKVCDEWLKDRNNFCEWALKNGYIEKSNLSIDRIDNTKGYFPTNCKWSTPVEQARNTRRTILTLEIAMKIREDAKKFAYRELAKKYDVSFATIGAVVSNRLWKE